MNSCTCITGEGGAGEFQTNPHYIAEICYHWRGRGQGRFTGILNELLDPQSSLSQVLVLDYSGIYQPYTKKNKEFE